MNAGTLFIGAAVAVACGLALNTEKKHGVTACIIILALTFITTWLLVR